MGTRSMATLRDYWSCSLSRWYLKLAMFWKQLSCDHNFQSGFSLLIYRSNPAKLFEVIGFQFQLFYTMVLNMLINIFYCVSVSGDLLYWILVLVVQVWHGWEERRRRKHYEWGRGCSYYSSCKAAYWMWCSGIWYWNNHSVCCTGFTLSLM